MALPIKFVTRYKHIYFAKSLGDPFWVCYARQDSLKLGTVRRHKQWAQHCFCPESDTLFSASCLKDIQHFIGQL